ncbi:hypothetical protein GGX14DRAFT_400483 [Mycena pura]|uniref:Uncharacterized protein n=1 Tax=Mycena pura TaxID=153505 RepID=A0AAD6V9N1_9AGAR|nr:hypothetical protein GGX14DRAFT_400483 [Mycena pura]
MSGQTSPEPAPVRVLVRFSRVDVIARVVRDRGTGRYAHAIVLELIPRSLLQMASAGHGVNGAAASSYRPDCPVCTAMCRAMSWLRREAAEHERLAAHQVEADEAWRRVSMQRGAECMRGRMEGGRDRPSTSAASSCRGPYCASAVLHLVQLAALQDGSEQASCADSGYAACSYGDGGDRAQEERKHRRGGKSGSSGLAYTVVHLAGTQCASCGERTFSRLVRADVLVGAIRITVLDRNARCGVWATHNTGVEQCVEMARENSDACMRLAPAHWLCSQPSFPYTARNKSCPSRSGRTERAREPASAYMSIACRRIAALSSSMCEAHPAVRQVDSHVLATASVPLALAKVCNSGRFGLEAGWKWYAGRRSRRPRPRQTTRELFMVMTLALILARRYITDELEAVIFIPRGLHGSIPANADRRCEGEERRAVGADILTIRLISAAWISIGYFKNPFDIRAPEILPCPLWCQLPTATLSNSLTMAQKHLADCTDLLDYMKQQILANTSNHGWSINKLRIQDGLWGASAIYRPGWDFRRHMEDLTKIFGSHTSDWQLPKEKFWQSASDEGETEDPPEVLWTYNVRKQTRWVGSVSSTCYIPFRKKGLRASYGMD